MTTTPVSFRYDFSETEQDKHYCSVISQMLGGFYVGVAGVEHRNKYGEEIKKHMHYNFLYPADEGTTKKFIEACRKRIQRANAETENPRGKGYYSITAPSVEDFDRWFRYSLKQVESFDQILKNERIALSSGFDLEIQWKMANEEYTRDLAFLSSRREAQDKRQTTLQKIIDLASVEVFTSIH